MKEKRVEGVKCEEPMIENRSLFRRTTLFEGDALGSLFFGDPDLLLGVGGEWVWGGQDVTQGAEAVLVSHEFDAGEAAVDEREAEGEKKKIKIV